MPAGPPPAFTHVVASAGIGSFWHVDLGGWFVAATGAYAVPVTGFLNWWDSVELWLSGLGFFAQTVIVMPVVLALAFGMAVLLDSALGQGIRLMRRVRHREPGEE
jgi:hypothetical protein